MTDTRVTTLCVELAAEHNGLGFDELVDTCSAAAGIAAQQVRHMLLNSSGHDLWYAVPMPTSPDDQRQLITTLWEQATTLTHVIISAAVEGEQQVGDDVLAALFEHSSGNVRATAVQLTRDLDEAAQYRVADDHDRQVVHALCVRDVTHAVQRHLVREDPAAPGGWATHPVPLSELASHSEHSDVLERLAEHGNEKVNTGLARNEHTPAHVLDIVANHDDEWVRSWVAMRNDLAEHTLERLRNDASFIVAQRAQQRVPVRSGA